MKIRYAIVFLPLFGVVPVFSSRGKAVAFCAGHRQHLMNIYPKSLGYLKRSNIHTGSHHYIVNAQGDIVYSAEIIKQRFNTVTNKWDIINDIH